MERESESERERDREAERERERERVWQRELPPRRRKLGPNIGRKVLFGLMGGFGTFLRASCSVPKSFKMFHVGSRTCLYTHSIAACRTHTHPQAED